MPATVRAHHAFAELVAPLLDEELVALQTFLPGGRWNAPYRRWARRAMGRGRVDDRLPTVSLLIVTPTRVSVRAVDYGYDLPGGMRIGDPLGEWQRAQVSGTVRPVTLATTRDGPWDLPDSTTTLDVRRATLQTPDGVLVADLPGHERGSIRICAELGLKKGIGPWRQLADRLRRR
jgi:hypothetical protein